MSFYAHPFQRRQAHGYPYATSPAASPAPAPSFNFYTAPHAHTRPATSYYDDIDAEEQAALAHLHAIQQRREAAQIAARREAALQAQIAAQREAAYAAAVERERAREEAIRQVVAEKQRRYEAAAAARAHAIEQNRRAHAIAAQRQAHALAAQHAYAQRAIEQKQAEEYLKRRNACARRCAGGCAKKDEAKQEKSDDWKEVNDVLASLFGINIFDSEAPATQDKKEEPVTEQKTTTAPAPSTDKVEPKVAAENKTAAPVAEPTTKTPTESKSDPASFDLNDLLSTFLGVSLEPAKDDDKPTEGADKLTAKLNDFLSQFGLEFEATNNTAEASSSAPKSAPVKVDTPAPVSRPTSAAVEGKGKAVAEGEKPTRPAAPAQPAQQAEDAASEAVPTSTKLDKLRDISHELHLATESFTFPSKLAFADTTNSDATPALLFNKGNSGYHAQAHKLLQLLLAADGISSAGDREVRKQRKAIVKAIEGAIEQLEQKRDAVWAEVKEKREHGAEVSDDEGSVSSWNSVEAEHIEHAEEAVETKVEVKEAEEVEEQQQDEESAKANNGEEASNKDAEHTYAEAAASEPAKQDEEVKGFEVPAEEQPEAKAKGGEKRGTKEDDFELL